MSLTSDSQCAYDVMVHKKPTLGLQISGTVPMIASMNRVRLVVQIDEDIRDALRLEAALRREDMGEIASRILREALADALDQIKRRGIHDSRSRKKQD